MDAVWKAILGVLIQLLIKVGLPYLIEWLRKKGLDMGEVTTIASEHVKEMKDAKTMKRYSKAKAKRRLVEKCTGGVCKEEQ